MVTAVVLIFGMIFALTIARNTTSPMRQLHKVVRRTEMENLTGKSEHRLLSAPREIADVYIDFKQMCEKLDISIKETINARTKEAEANFKALQAQMNPHFLYNTLSVIAESCDEGENENASFMCKRLAYMLRYVTRAEGNQTTLEKELNYTLDYLALMQKRYEGHLIYEIDIPNELMQVELPKLVLQPLVENSISHGFKNSRPPWKIKLTGRISAGFWELEVEDNGCGIENGRLDEIKHRIEDRQWEYSNESDGGLGLISTMVRLKLMYKGNLHYRLNNLKEHGFSVLIGFSSKL